MNQITESPIALSAIEGNSLRCINVCLKLDKMELAWLIIAGLNRKLTLIEQAKIICGLIDMIGQKDTARQKEKTS